MENINDKQAELKQEISDSTMQLTDKISNTNMCINELEDKFKKALHEHSVRLENKHKDLHVEWRTNLTDIHKQINDWENEQMNVIKRCV